MGLFNIFKKDRNAALPATDNGVPGPEHLEDVTIHIEDAKKLRPNEWRRQLKTSAGHTQFQIRYYGQLHQAHNNLVVATDFAPLLIMAVDVLTAQEILLFDGCKHGYNAICCNRFSEEQVTNRPATAVYRDKEGNDLFEIFISTYNTIDYEAEFAEEVDGDGLFEVADGSKVGIESLKRNGFSSLQIRVVDGERNRTTIVFGRKCLVSMIRDVIVKSLPLFKKHNKRSSVFLNSDFAFKQQRL